VQKGDRAQSGEVAKESKERRANRRKVAPKAVFGQKGENGVKNGQLVYWLVNWRA